MQSSRAGRFVHHGFVHDAYVYNSTAEFLAGALPFIRGAIAAGEPILVAPTEANIAILKNELGAEADRVDWADSPGEHKPLARLRIFRDFIADAIDRGAVRIRLLGEPAWPLDSPAGIAEWKRYESYLNVALEGQPVWLVCPYDAASLPHDIVREACCTHPIVGHGKERRPSADYVDPEQFGRKLDACRPLSPVPADAVERNFNHSAPARAFVVERAENAGIGGLRLTDMKLAAAEVVANVFRHAGGEARVSTWIDRPEFVCQVTDGGPGLDGPFSGLALPDPLQPNGRGLPLARQLCDAVEIRANAQGTTVRLHMRTA